MGKDGIDVSEVVCVEMALMFLILYGTGAKDVTVGSMFVWAKMALLFLMLFWK